MEALLKAANLPCCDDIAPSMGELAREVVLNRSADGRHMKRAVMSYRVYVGVCIVVLCSPCGKKPFGV